MGAAFVSNPASRRRPVLGIAAAVLVIALGVLIIRGFIQGRTEATREAERERPVKAALRVSTQNGVPVITLDDETRQRSGITTSVPSPAPHQEEIRAYGTVLDPARLTDLANMHANAKAQLQTAHAKLGASKTAFERARYLYNDQQNVSLAQLQGAEAAFRTDQAAVNAADSQVRTLGATAQQELGPVLGKALIEGRPMIKRLIERQDFLVQVTLPPGVSLAAPPATAALQVGGKGRAMTEFVSPATRTDPKLQGVSYFYVVPAKSGALPGMNVLAFLPVGRSVQGVTLPPAAIVWWQDRAWVYRRIRDNVFSRIQIPTEQPAEGGAYIASNLPKDAELVMNGAQMLLSEEFRAQIQVGEDKR